MVRLNLAPHSGFGAEDVERGAVHRGGARAAADAALEGDHLRPRPRRLRRQGPPGADPAGQGAQDGAAGAGIQRRLPRRHVLPTVEEHRGTGQWLAGLDLL